MAERPTVYIVASDQHRNGKTLLARMLTDYLLLDGHDPFLIDTDYPAGPLRAYFPGRTQLADPSNVQGEIKIFDRILSSTGRDYVVDLSAQHTVGFFERLRELDYVAELRKTGFRIVILFIVDFELGSIKFFNTVVKPIAADLTVPVRNEFVGSAWPEGEGALVIPVLDGEAMQAISDRHFSVREYVLGDSQNLPEQFDIPFKRFVYDIMQAFSNLEPLISLRSLRTR